MFSLGPSSSTGRKPLIVLLEHFQINRFRTAKRFQESTNKSVSYERASNKGCSAFHGVRNVKFEACNFFECRNNLAKFQMQVLKNPRRLNNLDGSSYFKIGCHLYKNCVLQNDKAKTLMLEFLDFYGPKSPKFWLLWPVK